MEYQTERFQFWYNPIFIYDYYQLSAQNSALSPQNLHTDPKIFPFDLVEARSLLLRRRRYGLRRNSVAQSFSLPVSFSYTCTHSRGSNSRLTPSCESETSSCTLKRLEYPGQDLRDKALVIVRRCVFDSKLVYPELIFGPSGPAFRYIQCVIVGSRILENDTTVSKLGI